MLILVWPWHSIPFLKSLVSRSSLLFLFPPLFPFTSSFYPFALFFFLSRIRIFWPRKFEFWFWSRKWNQKKNNAQTWDGNNGENGWTIQSSNGQKQKHILWMNPKTQVRLTAQPKPKVQLNHSNENLNLLLKIPNNEIQQNQLNEIQSPALSFHCWLRLDWDSGVDELRKEKGKSWTNLGSWGWGKILLGFGNRRRWRPNNKQNLTSPSQFCPFSLHKLTEEQIKKFLPLPFKILYNCAVTFNCCELPEIRKFWINWA